MIATMLLLIAMPQEAPLGWLVGTWCTDAVKGRTVCETWQPMAADHAMRGISVTTSAKGEQRETMRIVQGTAGLVFHAEPAGQAAADFQAALDPAPRSLTFVNTAHDYPQRVRYWREGEMLMAEIALADGGKPIRWTYRRVAN